MSQPKQDCNRDSRGRFRRGNEIASAGGFARAAALDPDRRTEIARAARAAMVRRHFHGRDDLQRAYFAQLGAFVYDQAAGAGRPGSPLRPIASHPGAIQDWIARQMTGYLFLDVDFVRPQRHQEAAR